VPLGLLKYSGSYDKKSTLAEVAQNDRNPEGENLGVGMPPRVQVFKLLRVATENKTRRDAAHLKFPVADRAIDSAMLQSLTP
jgi:hypothetical protein